MAKSDDERLATCPGPTSCRSSSASAGVSTRSPTPSARGSFGGSRAPSATNTRRAHQPHGSLRGTQHRGAT